MTTIERQERWRGLRHQAMRATVATMLGWAAIAWHPILPLLARIPLAGTYAVVFTSFVVHQRELCERCIAATPADPGRSVDREKPLLWLRHHAKQAFLAVLALTGVAFFFPQTSVTAMACSSASDIATAVLLFAVLRHSRLEPWCPWCRGGGDDDTADTPAPVDGDLKPVPA